MLQFFNSQSRRKEEFKPKEPGKAGVYCCGPTVYNYAHIGNFRAYVFNDILRRYLEYKGYDVNFVMNITDVEDKIIRDSAAAGVSISDFTEKYTQAFFEDLESLNIKPATHYPRATEHIGEMLDIVKRLEAKGLTYQSDGSVYYKVSDFKDYGKLSGIRPEELKAGARIDSDEYEKDDARDFVLWKANRGEAAKWDSPFGPGRPGWHIECSAMSMKYLGETVDIHCGGEDLVFPHHENEIAQSEGATGKPFVHYWLHNRYLLVDGEKMSKSKGNFYTLRDLIDKGYDPLDIRYVLMSAHYRSPLDFSLKAIDAASASRKRLLDFKRRLKQVADAESERECATVLEVVDRAAERFEEALDDDLDMPSALAAVFDFVSTTNRCVDAGELSLPQATQALSFLDKVDSVLGVMKEKEQIPSEEIEQLIEERKQARKDKNFARADEIRDELKARGVVLEDTPQGTRWHWE